MPRRFPSLLIAAGALATPSLAHAGQCEDSFVKKGSIISGMRFTATVSVADLPPDVAINQIRGIVAARGYDIIAAEPAAGQLLIEQSVSQYVRAFRIEINATSGGGTGTVVMEAKLRAGQSTKAELALAEMCGVLNQVKGGKAGRLSGEIDYLRPDGNQTRIAFKIFQPHEMVIRLPGMPQTIWDVSCLMAPGTSVFTAQLKPRKQVKLTGTFYDFSDTKEVVWFQNCRPAAK